MVNFAEIFTSREACMIYIFGFIFSFVGIYYVQKRRMLNYFQRHGMCLLIFGIFIRIITLTIDYLNMVVTGRHFIQRYATTVPSSLKIMMFIKTPEVLFEFPLFAISMDWLELAVILKTTSALSVEAYLKTHKSLQCVFLGTSLIVIILITFDILESLLDHSIIKNYHMVIDCMMGLITACFSCCVLALFICAYISLVISIKKI